MTEQPGPDRDPHAGHGAGAGYGIAGSLAAGGHRLPVRIYYEDTDFSGIVYHASYLRFLERGRTDFLRLMGIGHRELADGRHGEPLAFAVRAMTLDFLAPARIDDVVVVETAFRSVGGARLVLAQRIVVGEGAGGGAGRVLVEAEVTVVVISPEGKPRRLPAALRSRLGGAGAPAEAP